MAQDTPFLMFSLTIDYGGRVATPWLIHSPSPILGA
jgi:hypothetical protein